MNEWREDGHLAEAATLMKALADPNRLRVFALLLEGDSCNCELRDSLGLPANLLSHHLRVLRKAGLVNSRRDAIDGRWIYYSIDRNSVAKWRNWLQEFLDPNRIEARQVLCGPEGKQFTPGTLPILLDGEAVDVKLSGG